MGCASAYPNLCGELGHIRRKVLSIPICCQRGRDTVVQISSKPWYSAAIDAFAV